MLRSLCTIIKQCVVGGVYLLSCFIVYCGSTPGVNSIHQAHHTGVEATFIPLYSRGWKVYLSKTTLAISKALLWRIQLDENVVFSLLCHQSLTYLSVYHKNKF